MVDMIVGKDNNSLTPIAVHERTEMQITKSPQELQRYVDDLTLALNNYRFMAIKYICHQDEVYEAYKYDSNSIANVTGWLIYLINNMEAKQ